MLRPVFGLGLGKHSVDVYIPPSVIDYIIVFREGWRPAMTQQREMKVGPDILLFQADLRREKKGVSFDFYSIPHWN